MTARSSYLVLEEDSLCEFCACRGSCHCLKTTLCESFVLVGVLATALVTSAPAEREAVVCLEKKSGAHPEKHEVDMRTP